MKWENHAGCCAAWVAGTREILAILRRHLNKGLMTLGEARRFAERARADLEAAEHDVAMADVLALVEAVGCSANDRTYVALARKLTERTCELGCSGTAAPYRGRTRADKSRRLLFAHSSQSPRARVLDENGWTER